MCRVVRVTTNPFRAPHRCCRIAFQLEIAECEPTDDLAGLLHESVESVRALRECDSLVVPPVNEERDVTEIGGGAGERRVEPERGIEVAPCNVDFPVSIDGVGGGMDDSLPAQSS